MWLIVNMKLHTRNEVVCKFKDYDDVWSRNSYKQKSMQNSLNVDQHNGNVENGR